MQKKRFNSSFYYYLPFWAKFLEKLQPEFKNEPEPIKEVKEIDAETLKKKSEMAKSRGGLGAKYDVDNKKEEGEKKLKKGK